MKKVLSVALLLVFLGSTAMFLRSQQAKAESADFYREAREIAGLIQQTEAPQPVEAETIPMETAPQATEVMTEEVNWIPAPVEEDLYVTELAKTDLDALREYNPDVIGWIYIPGSKINYPIVQGEDNQYYLEHLWNGQESPAGAVFLESTHNGAMDGFYSILYGHNLNDGSMFGGLHYYETQAYFEGHPYVYLVTDAGVYRYEIYAAHSVSVDSIVYAVEIKREDTKARLIRETLADSEIDTGIIPEVTDRILTLSTCDGNYSVRWVVHARLRMIPET